jgi:hypothetical protein
VFHQRCEKNIFNQISRQDRHTIGNVFHVAEYCNDI